jgi:hypothetical protein
MYLFHRVWDQFSLTRRWGRSDASAEQLRERAYAWQLLFALMLNASVMAGVLCYALAGNSAVAVIVAVCAVAVIVCYGEHRQLDKRADRLKIAVSDE